jgi:hypothetical protein
MLDDTVIGKMFGASQTGIAGCVIIKTEIYYFEGQVGTTENNNRRELR